MGVLICLFILKLITFTETSKPQAVNLELETVLEFQDKDKAADVQFIGNIQKILKKVKTALSPENARRSQGHNNKQIKFTDFIISVADILQSYDDSDLEDVFVIFDEEIRKFHYKGCKFYELLEDGNVRKFIASNIGNLKDLKAKVLRKKLDKVITAIEAAKLMSGHRKFIHYINSLYRHDSNRKFMIFLQNLENYSYKSKRTNLNLIQILRDGIRTIIFDHFSKLHANVRKDVKKKIEIKWRDAILNLDNDTEEVNKSEKGGETETKTRQRDEVESDVSEIENDVKINVHKDDTKTEKKKHVKNRHKHKKTSSLREKSLRPKIPMKQIDIDITTEGFIPIWRENSKKQKRDRKKQKKLNHKIIETESEDENAQATMKTRNDIKSESVLRPSGPHDGIFINLENFNENRYSHTDLNNKKHKKQTTKQKHNSGNKKTKHSLKANRKNIDKEQDGVISSQSISYEGMSIEYGQHRRAMTNAKESAEAIRKLFKRRIDNLEKQMEEIISKIDDKDNTSGSNEETTTTAKIESTKVTKVETTPLNVTLAVTETSNTTQSNELVLIDTKSLQIKRINASSLILPNITSIVSNVEVNNDNGDNMDKSSNNTLISDDLNDYQTDFDYSEANIMKILNVTVNHAKEDPLAEDKKADKVVGNTGLKRLPVEIPSDNIVPSDNKELSDHINEIAKV